MKNMCSNWWLSEHYSDKFVKESKKCKYRSRAWFKIDEIQKKNNIIKPGMVVLDIGSSPGGWSKYSSQKVGMSGKVIACDIDLMNPIPNVSFILGNIFEKITIKKIKKVKKKYT